MNIQNNKLATSSQLKENSNNNNKDIRKINTPLNISKLTITNTSTKKQKTKNIKIKKEEKNNNKINPFRYEEKVKETRKKTLDVIKTNIKREKEKEKKIYIKKLESLSIAGRNEQKITKINQDTFFIEKKVNGVDNFNIFGVLDVTEKMVILPVNLLKVL